MAQPDSGDVRPWTAGPRRGLKANDPILAAVPFRSFDTKLMKAFEVVLIHFGDNCSLLDFMQKSPKRFQHFYRLITHPISPTHDVSTVTSGEDNSTLDPVLKYAFHHDWSAISLQYVHVGLIGYCRTFLPFAADCWHGKIQILPGNGARPRSQRSRDGHSRGAARQSRSQQGIPARFHRSQEVLFATKYSGVLYSRRGDPGCAPRPRGWALGLGETRGHWRPGNSLSRRPSDA